MSSSSVPPSPVDVDGTGEFARAAIAANLPAPRADAGAGAVTGVSAVSVDTASAAEEDVSVDDGGGLGKFVRAAIAANLSRRGAVAAAGDIVDAVVDGGADDEAVAAAAASPDPAGVDLASRSDSSCAWREAIAANLSRGMVEELFSFLQC
jgi:hypothetical protein